VVSDALVMLHAVYSCQQVIGAVHSVSCAGWVYAGRSLNLTIRFSPVDIAIVMLDRQLLFRDDGYDEYRG